MSAAERIPRPCVVADFYQSGLCYHIEESGKLGRSEQIGSDLYSDPRLAGFGVVGLLKEPHSGLLAITTEWHKQAADRWVLDFHQTCSLIVGNLVVNLREEGVTLRVTNGLLSSELRIDVPIKPRSSSNDGFDSLRVMVDRNVVREFLSPVDLFPPGVRNFPEYIAYAFRSRGSCPSH